MISIVTPCYNAASFIEATIDSVLSQKGADYELLILDGGSTDGTVEIIKRYEKYLAYWHSRKDGGQSAAIVEGFSLSKGDVLCWLNADDYFMPGALEKVQREFKENAGLQVLYGDYIVLDENGRMEAKPKISYDFEICLLFYLMIPQPSCFWSRGIYDKIGGVNPNFQYAFDWDLFLRMGEALQGAPGAIQHVHDLYSVFRLHAESKSVSAQERFREERKQIQNQFEYYRNLKFKKLAKWVQIIRTISRYHRERGVIPTRKDARKA